MAAVVGCLVIAGLARSTSNVLVTMHTMLRFMLSYILPSVVQCTYHPFSLACGKSRKG